MKLPEPVAWMYTNVQSGDIEVSANHDEKQDEREYWHRAPLFTEDQLREALASQAEELEQLQEQNTALDAKLAQQEAVMKMALEALNQDVEAYWDGYPYAEAIKALEDALK